MAAGQEQTSGPSRGTKVLEHITPEVRSRLAVKVGSALKGGRWESDHSCPPPGGLRVAQEGRRDRSGLRRLGDICLLIFCPGRDSVG